MTGQRVSFGSRLALSLLAGLVVMGAFSASEAWAWPFPNPHPVPHPYPHVYPWHNPTIYDSGDDFSGVYVDPFTGRVRIQTHRERVRASALDPLRNHVDAGSLQYVNRTECDLFGNVYRIQGYTWTSYGTPHSTLTRTRIQYTGMPGVDHEESTTEFRAARGASGTGRGNNN